MIRSRAKVEAFSLFSFQDIITSVTGVMILVTLMLAVELVQRKMATIEAATLTTDQTSSDRLARLEEQIEEARATLHSGESFIAQVAEIPSSNLSQREAELKRTVEQLSEDVKQIVSAITSSQQEYDTDRNSQDLPHLQNELSAARSKIGRLMAQLRSLEDSHQVIYNPNPFSQKTAWLVDLSPGVIRVAEPGKIARFREFKDGAIKSAVGDFLSWAKQRDKQSEYFVLLLRPKAIKLYEEVQRQLVAVGFDSGVDLIESNAIVVDRDDEGT